MMKLGNNLVYIREHGTNLLRQVTSKSSWVRVSSHTKKKPFYNFSSLFLSSSSPSSSLLLLILLCLHLLHYFLLLLHLLLLLPLLLLLFLLPLFLLPLLLPLFILLLINVGSSLLFVPSMFVPKYVCPKNMFVPKFVRPKICLSQDVFVLRYN